MAEYIEKEDAIRAIKWRFSMPVDNLIVEAIGSIPTADVESVRHGMWIYDGPNFRGGTDWCHCSECQSLEVWAAKTPFCSHCGAEMTSGKR